MPVDTETQLLAPDRRPLCEKWIARLNRLAGRLDQVEACGDDCSDLRAIADHLSQQFARIRDHVCDNKPVPKV